MLLSGKWFFIITLLSVTSNALAGTSSKPSKGQFILSKDESKVRQDQEAAFNLSTSQKLMPEEQWFVEKAYVESDDSDPMSNRWVKSSSYSKSSK